MVAATAPPPPPPPPKNAARLLALTLAESAQQAPVQTQSSGLCTPQSPPSSQGAAHFQEAPQTLFKISPEEGPVTSGLAALLPNHPTLTPTSSSSSSSSSASCPIPSSPTVKQPPLDLPTSVVQSSGDTTCSTHTEPGSALSDPPQGPGSPGLASPTRKAPEQQQQQQGFTGQIPVQTSHAPASHPSGHCRDSEVLSKPEVKLVSLSPEVNV